MGRCVRRRPHRPANLLAFEINEHNVFGLELGVVYAARFDAEDSAATVNHADVAEREVHEAKFRQLKVCLVALFLDGLVAHFVWRIGERTREGGGPLLPTISVPNPAQGGSRLRSGATLV